jgi:hypothetical protein
MFVSVDVGRTRIYNFGTSQGLATNVLQLSGSCSYTFGNASPWANYEQDISKKKQVLSVLRT